MDRFEDYDFMDRFMPNNNMKTLFRQQVFRTKREFLEYLEHYHVLTRVEVINKLNSYEEEKGTLLNNSRLSKYTQYSGKMLKRSSEFKGVEQKYNVIIHVINELSVLVIYDETLFDRYEEVELDLGSVDTIRFKRVTPVNYQELCGIFPTRDTYDYKFLFRVLIIDCASSGGSDLHINTRHRKLKPYYTVDYRRDIYMWRNTAWELDEEMVKRLVHSAIEKDTSANRRDIDLSGTTSDNNDLLGDGNFQLRITVVPALSGYKMTVRIQELKTVSKVISELGFDEEVTNALYDLSKKQSGLTLMVGPMRTGKNTTAFAVANSMPLSELCVMDLSSPVEIRMDFTQVDYRGNVDLLLQHIKLMKKLDVDLCFINEIPSRDVAFAVRDLINSSVGVITTMHVDRIWHLPHKLKEFYGEDYKDVLSQINGVVTQKMFVKQCTQCANEVLITTLPANIREFLEQDRFSHIPGNHVLVNSG